jgi:hypothetical protein
LLTSAQLVRSLPELEIIENNEVPLESEGKSSEDSYLMQNENGEEEEEQAQPVENDSVNYEGELDNDYNDEYYDDDDDTVDAELLERTLGIDIPICAKHADLKYPLHTR